MTARRLLLLPLMLLAVGCSRAPSASSELQPVGIRVICTGGADTDPCEGHSGDSEFIAVDVVRANDVWRTERVFLSGHCFDKLDADCRWYQGNDLDQFEWQGGRYVAPVTWVADGKGANYPTRSACDRGHLFYDTCDRNDVRQRYPILSHAQNVGSPLAPAGDQRGCLSWQHTGIVSAKVAPGSYECFWDAAAEFRGWQRPARGSATPYDRYLREIAKF